MIKIILEIGSVNYDSFIRDMLDQAKQHPEMLQGLKLPPFSDKLIKLIPGHQKNELVVRMVREHKAEMIPKVEAMLEGALGAVRIYDMDLRCSAQDLITAEIEILSFDYDAFTDLILPRYYHESSAGRILAEAYDGRNDMQSVQQIIHAQATKNKELMCARSISAEREYLISSMERAAGAKNVQVDIRSLRVMVK